jgi:hypothetical protein
MASLIGRSLALCVHPHAAWRHGPRARLVIFGAYFVASYAAVLIALSL